MKKSGICISWIKIIILSLITITFLSGCNGLTQTDLNKSSHDLTILFFNDIHGHLMPFKVKTDNGRQEVGGVARLATLIRTIKEKNQEQGIPTIVLIAGDILQGTPMSTVFKGKPDIECFNVIGIDAMTVGNHEFDFGLENFMMLKRFAMFPFISANIVFNDSRENLCPSAVAVSLPHGLELIVIGVTTKDLLTTTKAENVEQLAVLDPVESVKTAYSQLKNHGPVILLSHSRHQTDRDIACALPSLSAIIGGHDQILLSPYKRISGVPIFQAFEKGRYLGRIDLKIVPGKQQTKLVSYTYVPVTSEIEPDTKIAKIIKSYYDQLDNKFKEVIGKADTLLDGERERIRHQETALGNFVTDIMRKHTGAQIALINSGALRASIPKGPITVEDIFKAMPYANEIVLVELTGTELTQVLNRSVRGNREEEDGGFLQVSGIRFKIQDHKVHNIEVGKNRKPLALKKQYTVAIIDFMATGGDGYDMFAEMPIIYTRLPLRELIVDTVRNMQTISAHVEGRIIR